MTPYIFQINRFLNPWNRSLEKRLRWSCLIKQHHQMNARKTRSLFCVCVCMCAPKNLINTQNTAIEKPIQITLFGAIRALNLILNNVPFWMMTMIWHEECTTCQFLPMQHQIAKHHKRMPHIWTACFIYYMWEVMPYACYRICYIFLEHSGDITSS